MRNSSSITFFLLLLFASNCSVAQNLSSIEDAEKLVWDACLTGESGSIQSACVQLASTGGYGADKLEYASNLLSSVEVNGILFTGSKGDTYPVMMLQYLKGMRNDIRVIHIDWLKDASYFERIKATIGIEKKGVAGIRALAKKLPVYVSLAAGRDLITDMSSKLYCTGLAFKYSEDPLANVKGMQSGWWRNCGKNFMTSGYSLNANYLIPLAMLASYAKRTDHTEEYEVLRQKYAEVAKSVGESEKIPITK